MKTSFLSKITNVVSAIIIFAGVLTGCQNGFLENSSEIPIINTKSFVSNEFSYFGKIIKCKPNERIWQKQLSLAFDNQEYYEKSDLEMKDYKFIRKINDFDEVKKMVKELLKDENLIPQYDKNPEIFYLGSIANVKEEIEFKLDILISNIPNAFFGRYISTTDTVDVVAPYIFEVNDMGVVNIEWKYKDDIISTICLVSDKKGIVYDHILSNIHIRKEINETKTYIIEDEDKKILTPRLKVGNESGTGNCNSGYTYVRHFREGYESWDNNGQLEYRAIANFMVYANCDNGLISLTHYSSVYGEQISSLYWNAAAQAHEKSFTTGVNGSLSVDYAYYISPINISLSLSYNGFGFTVSPQNANGRSGTEYTNRFYW